MSDLILPIALDNSSPTIEPLRGDMRLVKLVPTPYGGLRWCLWISPYTFQDEIRPGETGACRKCCVLLDKGTPTCPRPEVAWLTIPDFLLNHPSTPTAPIEW
jgi:hypothetical protein